jgi:hypothetical protein
MSCVLVLLVLIGVAVVFLVSLLEVSCVSSFSFGGVFNSPFIFMAFRRIIVLCHVFLYYLC